MPKRARAGEAGGGGSRARGVLGNPLALPHVGRSAKMLTRRDMRKRIPQGSPRPRPTTAGFTLLEVLVALAILSIAVVASIQGFAQGLRLLKLAGDHQQATLIADQK